MTEEERKAVLVFELRTRGVSVNWIRFFENQPHHLEAIQQILDDGRENWWDERPGHAPPPRQRFED
jgi:hypothetical protein